jgi:lysophospholipase L1-like esterase
MRQSTSEIFQEGIRGVAELTSGAHGLKPRRLASKYAMYHDTDPLTQKVADQPSGARLSLECTGAWIRLTYRALFDATADGSYDSAPSTVALTHGNLELVQAHSNGDRRVWSGDQVTAHVTGEDSIALFEIGEAGTAKAVDIWLPHNCEVELVDLESDGQLVAREIESPRWVHYGSSISHSLEADAPTGVWPVVAARKLGLDLFSLGLAGSANIEQFAAESIAELPADFISLKLGINPVNGRNMTRRTFVPAVHSFLDTVRRAHPETPILVISPVYCEVHEDNPGPTLGGPDGRITAGASTGVDWVGDLTLVSTRALLEEIVQRREDANLFYLNGLELFGELDFHLAPDGLHPNAEGYRLIGERFAEIVSNLSLFK